MTNPDPKFTNSETALGGADAIEKTTYVVGQGTEPSGKAGDSPNAHPRAGGGPNYVAWGIGALAALVALAYLVGMMG